MTRARRVAIVGARLHKSGTEAWWQNVEREIDDLISYLPTSVVIVSGGAIGVDRIAENLARFYGNSLCVFLPDYAAHGVRAPLIRNQLIVDDCDELHAFPAPWSRGTWDTIRKAKAAGKPVTVHTVETGGEVRG